MISDPDTQALAHDALAPGGALLLVMPDARDEARKAAGEAAGTRVVMVYGVVHPPENRVVGVEILSRVEGWLEAGTLVVRLQ